MIAVQVHPSLDVDIDLTAIDIHGADVGLLLSSVFTDTHDTTYLTKVLVEDTSRVIDIVNLMSLILFYAHSVIRDQVDVLILVASIRASVLAVDRLGRPTEVLDVVVGLVT